MRQLTINTGIEDQNVIPRSHVQHVAETVKHSNMARENINREKKPTATRAIVNGTILSSSFSMHASIHSLPLDALVQILCKLNHHELKPLITVSKSFHDAACIARQLHFDFSTPSPKKTSNSFGDMDATPDALMLRPECKKSRKVRLSDEDTRKIAIALFPVGDCKRGLMHELRWTMESQQPMCHTFHANV